MCPTKGIAAGGSGSNAASLGLSWSHLHGRGPANVLSACLPSKTVARFGRVNATQRVAGRGQFLGLEVTACNPERNY